MPVVDKIVAPATCHMSIRGYGSRIALAEPVIGRAFARPVGSLVRDDVIDSIFKQPSRHCEERSDEAIHSSFARRDGLLRCARNDGFLISNMSTRSRGARRPRFCKNRSPNNSEGAGNAGRSMRPQPRVQGRKHTSVVTTVTPEITRHSPRNGFTAYFALSPVTRLV